MLSESEGSESKEQQNQNQTNSMTFTKALSFIYQEYANYQGDKDLWTLEKCEYQAKIAMLQGELESMRSLNSDLITRIKMLEYALKKERKLNDNNGSFTDSDKLNEPNDKSPLPSAFSDKMDLEPQKSSTDILRGYIMEITRCENFIALQRQMSQLKRPIKSLFTLYPNESRPILPTEEIDSTQSASTSSIQNSICEDTIISESPADQVRRYVQIYKNEVSTKRQKSLKESDDLEKVPDSVTTSSVNDANSRDGEVETEILSSFNFLPGFGGDQEEAENSSPPPVEPEVEEAKEQQEFSIPTTFLAKLSSKKGSSGNPAKSNFLKKSKESLFTVAESVENESESSRIQNSDSSKSKQSVSKEYTMFIMAKFHVDSVRAVGFNSSDCYPAFATGSDDCSVALWDAQINFTHKNPKPLAILRGHSSPILSLTFIPNHSDMKENKHQLCTSSKDGSIIYWTVSLQGSKYIPSLDDYQQTSLSLSDHSDAVWSLSSTFDQSHKHSPMLLSCSADGLCCIWSGFDKEFPESQNFNILPTTNSQIGASSVKFCDYDSKYFAASFEETLSIWDVASQKQVSSFNLHNKDHENANFISCICPHHSQPLILVGWNERLLQKIDTRTGKSTGDVSVDHSIVSSLSFNPSGDRFASSHSDGYTMIWDWRSYRSIQSICTHNVKYDEGVMSCVFHPSLDILAVSGADDIVKVFC